MVYPIEKPTPEQLVQKHPVASRWLCKVASGSTLPRGRMFRRFFRDFDRMVGNTGALQSSSEFIVRD